MEQLPAVSPATPPSNPPRRRKHKGFPRKKRPSGAFDYDHVRIRTEFFDASEMEWADYCAARDYNPSLNFFPWRSWVREKKYRRAFNDVKADIEREGSALGPRLLLQQVRAVRNVPETAAVMLQLIQHSIRIHLDEAKHDEPHLKALREQGIPIPPAKLRFSLDPSGAAMLASALKATSELLHKSLGIDTSIGMTPERWAQMVETEVGKIDGTLDSVTQGSKNPVTVEIMGTMGLKEALKDAFEKWMDKPGTADSLEMGEPLPAEPAEQPTEHDAASD